MSNVVPLRPPHRIVEVANAVVYPPGGNPEEDGEWAIVVVVFDTEGNGDCVWSGHDANEALRVAAEWHAKTPLSKVLVSADFGDDGPDGPDGGERIAA